MNVGQYRQKLSDLELKKAEVTQVHDQYAFGYAKIVLEVAKGKIETEINDLLSIELMPVPVVISIGSSVSSLLMAIDGTEQLAITATSSDGSTRDVTSGYKAFATYRDADGAYNNKGFITSIDVSDFVFPAGASIKVVKTATGWNVYSSERLGLSLVETDVDTFDFVDIDGDPIGVQFVTNGNEEKGDNWLIEVEVRVTGTEYETSDENVASVDNNGNVYALGEGEAEITVTNNGNTIVIPVTVA